MADGDRTVQVPVSLIERMPHGQWCRTRNDVQPCNCSRADFIALLSQPTPTAEPNPWPTEGRFEADGTYSSVDTLRRRWQPAEPPRIEDMAPGTTFHATLLPGFDSTRKMHLWFVSRTDALGTRVSSSDGERWTGKAIDPSTIRNVTPPTGGDHD